MEGLEAFRSQVLLMSDNAVKFSAVLGDPDLQRSAELLSGRFLELYQRKRREIEGGVYF